MDTRRGGVDRVEAGLVRAQDVRQRVGAICTEVGLTGAEFAIDWDVLARRTVVYVAWTDAREDMHRYRAEIDLGAVEASLAVLREGLRAQRAAAARDPQALPAALDLDAIEARANAATRGPWKRGTGYEQSARGNYVGAAAGSLVCAEQDGTDCELGDADAAFIAAARTDVPALVARVRALEAQLAAERESCAALCDDAARRDWQRIEQVERGSEEHVFAAAARERALSLAAATNAFERAVALIERDRLGAGAARADPPPAAMNLYLLTALPPMEADYDCAHGFVIAAESEARARGLIGNAHDPRAPHVCGVECRPCRRRAWDTCESEEEAREACAWTRPELASCELLGTAREGEPAGVVLRDYHAG